MYITDLIAWCNINFGNSAANPLIYSGYKYSGNLYLDGELVTELKIPEGVNSIENYVFHSCRSITSITIPNSVTSIGIAAFSGCTNLTSVVIPDSVTSIEKMAFYDCTSLTEVTIGNGVTSIGDHALQNCKNLTEIHYGGTEEQWSTISFGNQWDYGTGEYTVYFAVNYSEGLQFMKMGVISKEDDLNVDTLETYAVTGIGTCTDTDIRIPPTYEGKPVIWIDNYAFSDCSDLTSVTIPDSVTNIQSGAFEGCINLTSVTIPNSVTWIGNYAFEGCSSLTAVYITDLATWCQISFGDAKSNPLYYAKNLYLNGELVTDLTLPDGLTSIEYRAFYNCSSLTNVTIPESVTSIGAYAFYNCSGLISINIPDNVTSIEEYLFYGCSNLTSVTIGNEVTYIGEYSFYGCSNLTSIIIPRSVKYIRDSAFSNCNNLVTVYYSGTETLWARISIDNSNAPFTSATVYYYTETAPTVVGNYWRYVDGVPTKW